MYTTPRYMDYICLVPSVIQGWAGPLCWAARPPGGLFMVRTFRPAPGYFVTDCDVLPDSSVLVVVCLSVCCPVPTPLEVLFYPEITPHSRRPRARCWGGVKVKCAPDVIG